MEIFVNGNPVSLPGGCTLSGLIETLALQNNRVAIEVNREIVPRSQHNSFHLRQGDRVEIVQAIGGG